MLPTTGEPPRIYAHLEDRRAFLRGLATPAGALLPTRAMVPAGARIVAVISGAGHRSTLELSLEVCGRQLKRRRDRLSYAGLTVRYAEQSGPWLDCAAAFFDGSGQGASDTRQVTCVVPSVADLRAKVSQLVRRGVAHFPIDLTQPLHGVIDLCCVVPWPLLSLRFRAEVCGYRPCGVDGDLEVRLSPGEARERLLAFLACAAGPLVQVREAPEPSSC